MKPELHVNASFKQDDARQSLAHVHLYLFTVVEKNLYEL